jgi:hypothetical protein
MDAVTGSSLFLTEMRGRARLDASIHPRIEIRQNLQIDRSNIAVAFGDTLTRSSTRIDRATTTRSAER